MSTLERPNIILIMIESWDGKVLGMFGDPALKNITPHLDRYATEATVFPHNYTTNPVCCPARANLWSGQHTFHCKSWNNHKGLEKDDPILPDLLRQEGYILANNKPHMIGIGKHDYLSGHHTNQNRVTAWTGAANIELPSYMEAKPKVQLLPTKKVHIADWIRTKEAIEFLKKQQIRQQTGDHHPFFLYLSLTTPHPRFRTSKYWLKKVNYNAVSIPPQDEEEHPVIRFQRISKDWRHGFAPDMVRKTRAIYYAMVAEVEQLIGDVLNTVKTLNLDKNTYVIITGDHGECNMEHQLYYKSNMYEPAVHVPLIIGGPGIQPGKMLPNIVSHIDLYPTILDMAKIDKSKIPQPIDGESLLPLLEGKTDKSRDTAFAMFTGSATNTSMWMLRKGDWKYIAYIGYPPQLFNLKSDPDEIKNYAHERTDLVKEFDAELQKLVDYPTVHKEWQHYCKTSFRAYRERVRAHPIPLFEYGAAKARATYEDVIANCYKGWTLKHAEQLEKWLNSPD